MKHIPISAVRPCESKPLLRLIVVCPFLCALVACTAEPPRRHMDPRPIPTAEQRTAFGVIGIASAGIASPGTPNAPESKSTAEKVGVTAGSGAAGAGVGAIWGLACGPLAGVCVPVFAGAGAFAGTLAGGAVSIPYRTPEQVNNADITLRNALNSVDVAHQIVVSLLAKASQMPELDVKRINYSREGNSWDLRDGPDEIHTRLLIETPRIALVIVNQTTDWNPNVRLEITVEGKIFEKNQEGAAFERRWLYFSEVHDYFEWAEENGHLVLAEIDRAIADMSDRIIADFLRRNSDQNLKPS